MGHRLLSGMCDAVVYLDTDLCIAQPCPKLAALLLRPSGASSLMALPFLDLLPAADRNGFAQSLNAAARGLCEDDVASPVCVTHLHLLGANQIPFAVKLFSSCTFDGQCRQYHLIGIEEDSEDHNRTDSLPLLELRSQQTPAPDVVGMRQRQGSQSADSSMSSGVRDNSSSSSTGSADNCVAEVCCFFSESNIFYDEDQNELPALFLSGYSTAFGAMLGPSCSAKVNLFRWIKATQIQAFLHFVRLASSEYDAYASCLLPDAAAIVDFDIGLGFQKEPSGTWIRYTDGHFDITFQPPHLLNKLCIKARVTLSFDKDACQLIVIKAHFENVNWKKARERRQKPGQQSPRRHSQRVTQSQLLSL